jgi:hypothetical protein
MLNSCDLQILQLMFEDIQKYPNHLYWLIAFSFAILFIFILFIGYIAYIKGKNSEKGKIDARLKLLDSLVHEQSKIVEAVEVIKSNIEKGIWLEKERNAIKRQKIDEMMSNLSKIHPYLFKQLGELTTGNGNLDYENNPISMILDTANLYFETNEIEGLNSLNSLQADIAEVNNNHFTKKIEYLKETGKMMTTDNDVISNYSTTINKYIEPISQLRFNLGKLMSSLLGSKNFK